MFCELFQKLQEFERIIDSVFIGALWKTLNNITFEMQIELQSNQTNKRPPDQVLLTYRAEDVQGECILLEVSPIKFIVWRYVLFLLSNVLILIPWLLTFWYPKFKKFFYYDFCGYEEATDFYILNYDEGVSIVKREGKVFMIDQEKSQFYTYFVNRYMTYIIDENMIVRVSLYDYRQRIVSMIKSKKTETGLTECQAHQLINTYGPGTMKIEKPHCVDLTINQILRPLYLFLLFSVSYWTWAIKYFYFAGTLFFVSLVGLIVNIYQMVQLNDKIFAMAYYQVPVNVLRQGKVQSISSLDVSPGDIVFLKDPIKIPFEGIILEGSALINECALTGESVPIVKKADTFEKMSSYQPIDKNSFVYEGTTIIQVNDKKKMSKFQAFREAYGVPVCVVRTNFVTTKGQLIRIILFPKEQENIFQKQSTKFLLFLFLLAVCTFIVLVILIHQYVQPIDLFTKFIDLITITVPPALPVSMTFGIIYAVSRLQDKNIFCIAQNKVITGGMIEFSCFDKTGTLTEDYMDFYALVPAQNNSFSPAIINSAQSIDKMLADVKTQPYLSEILTNMASNNSIIKIEATSELIGDPMEIKAFEFGRFQLNQSHSDPDVIFGFESQRGHNGVVLRRFEFDSDLQRMSVVCKSSSGKGSGVYAKGSPEIMTTIMQSSSIPKNYSEILKQYASHGFRVLAIGSKQISEGDIKNITRATAEKDLIFNGFEVFQNKLKPQTKGAIAQLKAAKIGCVMITGDNTLTGSNISYKCEISNKAKGMLICDLIDGKFVTQDFEFEEDEEDVEPNQLPKASPHKMVELDGDNYMTTMKSADKIHANSGEQFMQSVSETAIKTNCQLCVTGRAFNELFSGLITDLTPIQKRFMDLASVFARTKPNDKAKIVMVFQHMDRKVSMCGDGANDCGALKQADIGLSLSMAEASISAPFTSKVANISAMVELIKECRAGLATNFSLFNIMAIYSLIQYTTTVISQKYLQYPADLQYLYWDLALNFFFILFIGNTYTAQELSIQKPKSSLFCFSNLFQIMIAFGTQMAGQISILAIHKLVDAEYYDSNGGMGNAIVNYTLQEDFVIGKLEASTVFVFSNNLYVATMLAFNIAKPWREYFFTNLPLMISIFVALTYNQMLILWQEATWSEFFVDFIPTMNHRWAIFGASWGFGILIYINQRAILVPFFDWLSKKYPNVKWL